MINSLWYRCRLLLLLALFLVLVQLVNVLSGMALLQFGVLPRHTGQWWHIFLAPFIHGNWLHLANNLMGLLLFGGICLLRSVRYFLSSSLFIIVVSGCLVWLFARHSLHVGASGWIFGLWSLCISNAWFDRRISSIIIALLVIFYYGGMIYGVLPGDSHISFEYHFFGAVAGVLCAAWGRKMPKRIRKYVT